MKHKSSAAEKSLSRNSFHYARRNAGRFFAVLDTLFFLFSAVPAQMSTAPLVRRFLWHSDATALWEKTQFPAEEDGCPAILQAAQTTNSLLDCLNPAVLFLRHRIRYSVLAEELMNGNYVPLDYFTFFSACRCKRITYVDCAYVGIATGRSI